MFGWSSAAAGAPPAGTLLGLGIRAEMRRQEFQRDRAAEALVASFVHPAHAAGTECRLHQVLGDSAILPFDRVDARAPPRRCFQAFGQIIEKPGTFVAAQQ